MKIVFTGGGTAGHIFPIIAIIREMRKTYLGSDLRLFYLGPKDSWSKGLLQKEGVTTKIILSGKLRRYFSLKNIIDVFKVPIGILQSFFYLFFVAPDLVFSKGGYGSFPVAVAARILHIPIFLHESDATPGLAAKIESKWALEIFVSFYKTDFFKKDKMVVVGNPIRKGILEGSKEEAKGLFNLKGDKPLILILGGSQGSKKINEIIISILPDIVKDFEVLHVTGKRNFKQTKLTSQVVLKEKEKPYYHPFPFLDDKYLRGAFAAADLVISRAGSGALFEIAACGKPSIIIPLPNSAQDHQIKNAYKFADAEACRVIEEENLRPYLLLETIKTIFRNPGELQSMASAARRFSKPKAAEIIANYILEYLQQTG
ncbi:undecaprenyldiphospho-muramoylpentapeptide beta-N-acetylglucosaminyltransferase [bacterium]|nr:undecaprenyldiphospho-muramoylpentapeptide beta-N-acetylglucosaminyltransferase [bacterium]